MSDEQPNYDMLRGFSRRELECLERAMSAEWVSCHNVAYPKARKAHLINEAGMAENKQLLSNMIDAEFKRRVKEDKPKTAGPYGESNE